MWERISIDEINFEVYFLLVIEPVFDTELSEGVFCLPSWSLVCCCSGGNNFSFKNLGHSLKVGIRKFGLACDSRELAIKWIGVFTGEGESLLVDMMMIKFVSLFDASIDCTSLNFGVFMNFAKFIIQI